MLPGAVAAQDQFAAAQRVSSDARGTWIVLLGTGTPNPEPDRSGPAIAVVVDDTPYLIDFGPGVVRRAAAAQQRGVQALRISNLKHAFVTHLHSDHTAGFADLILTPWVLERDSALRVWGPPGTRSMADRLLAAYAADIRMRTSGAQPIDPAGIEVVAVDIEPGEVYRDERVRVEAFAVPHGDVPRAYGYKFTTPDGVVVISGDTGPFEAMAEIARGADALVHEAYATEGWRRREPEWQDYHLKAHTSATDVGRLAARAQVKRVVLVHQLLWGATEEQMVEEVRAQYEGPVIYGRDLDVIEIGVRR
jgi:ribonuclease BN (tRNA processing enzyme)